MNQKLVGILVCLLFFGASICQSISGYNEEIVKNVIYDYNTIFKQVIKNRVILNNNLMMNYK